MATELLFSESTLCISHGKEYLSTAIIKNVAKYENKNCN